MRNRKLWPFGAVILAATSLIAMSSSWGQEQPPPPPGTIPAALSKPQAGNQPAFTPFSPAALAKLPVVQQQIFLAAKAGKEWLLRVNFPNGRFLNGLEPSLGVSLKDDNFLHQAGAAFALARSAQYFKEPGATAVARQAQLTLLLETSKDPNQKNPQVRYPIGTGAAQQAAAGLLVLAISELPQPGADLLQQSEELCLFLRSQQQKNGSLGQPPSQADLKMTNLDETAWAAPGIALYALARSLKHGPEPWKLETLRKGREFYRAQWLADKNTALIPWFSAACVEAYLLTKEQSFAECVFEMNDWLCTLQYNEIQPQRLLWSGGFKKWEQGAVRTEAPDVHSAVFIEGLAQACRVAKERGDLPRYQTYRQTAEKCAQFLLTLQYTESNSQHFEANYRQKFLLGGFHPTQQSGLLRLDFTQEAVAGLVKYLADVAEVQ